MFVEKFLFTYWPQLKLMQTAKREPNILNFSRNLTKLLAVTVSIDKIEHQSFHSNDPQRIEDYEPQTTYTPNKIQFEKRIRRN